MAASHDPPLGDLKWVERERAWQVVFGATMVAAEPAAVITSRPAIFEQFPALEARSVAGVGGFRKTCFTIAENLRGNSLNSHQCSYQMKWAMRPR
jgi:hypothetical protein